MHPTKIENKVPSRSIEVLDWPCRPRRKPLAFSDSTHDMLDFDAYVNGKNIIDWTGRNTTFTAVLKSHWYCGVTIRIPERNNHRILSNFTDQNIEVVLDGVNRVCVFVCRGKFKY